MNMTKTTKATNTGTADDSRCAACIARPAQVQFLAGSVAVERWSASDNLDNRLHSASSPQRLPNRIHSARGKAAEMSAGIW
jgi:hypothetical protein